MGFLTVMLGLMAMRQALTLMAERESWTIAVGGHATELPGLMAGVMAFLAVFLLERIITEHNQAERELQERRDKSAALAITTKERRELQEWIDTFDTFVGKLDPDGVGITFNEPPIKAGGLTKEDVVGKYFPDTPWWSHSEIEMARVVVCIERARTGLPSRIETNFRSADGTPVPIIFNCQPVMDDCGGIKYLTAEGKTIVEEVQLRDALQQEKENLEKRVAERTSELAAVNENLREEIAERKRAAEALRESEKFFSGTLNDMLTFVAVLEPGGKVIFVNNTPLDVAGITLSDVKGKMFYDAFWWQYSEEARQQIEEDIKICATGKTLVHEIELKTVEGGLIWIEYSMHPIHDEGGKIKYLVPEGRDITERKRAEEALAKTSEKSKELETIVNQSPAVVFLWSAVESWPVEFVSDNVRQFGYTPEDFYSGRIPFESIVHPDDRGRVAAEVARNSEQGGTEFVQEYRVITSSGDVRWLDDRTWIRRSPDGAITHYQGIVLDITDRKRVEERLKESELRLRAIFDNANDGILMADVKSKMFFTGNKKIRQMLGYTEEELKTLGVKDIHPEKDVDRVLRQFEKQSKGELPVAEDVPVKRKDGSVFYADVSASTVKLDGSTYVVGIFRDITERRQAVERIKIINDFLQRVTAKFDIKYRLTEICRTVVQLGYKMAWIGQLREKTKDVVPSAQAGFDEGYLKAIKVKYDDSPLGQGPTGRALRNKQTEVQDHISTDPRYRPWREEALKRGYNSSAAMPIIFEQRIIGVLNVYNADEVFPLWDVEFLQTFASQTAPYIRNAHLFEKVKKSEKRIKEEMEITGHLLNISKTTAQTTNIDRLMKGVTEGVQRVMRSDVCVSYLWESETRLFRPCESAGLANDMAPFFRIEPVDVELSFIKKALDTKAPVVEKMAAGRTGTDGGVLYRWIQDIDTVAVVPFLGRRAYLGILVCLYRKSNPRGAAGFSERDMELLGGIGNQVSTSLEEARLYKDSIDRAMELSHKIETIQTMHEIDKSVLSILEPQQILETAVNMITKVIPCESATVTLADREKEVFTYAAGFGVACLRKGGLVPFKDTCATEIINDLRPMYIANLRELREPLSMEKRLVEDGLLSYIMVPLTVKGEGRGLLSLGARRPSAFTAEDLSTLEKLSSQISVALENSRLITDLEELFLGMLRTLAETIDAKSPWTRGHSERVTRFAIDIGREMGLDDEDLRQIEIAGLLHDIGKLATYEAILDKPGKLTDEEFSLVKKHPAKSAEILAPIKQLKDIIPAIKHHHEFLDGSGYPDGLIGEEIPPMARILAVADTVDAMGADRPYRKGRSTGSIVAELKRCAGTQFDPAVVNAYLKTV